MNSWQEDLQEWINNQHGTAGWEQKLENFIQSILDRKAGEIEKATIDDAVVYFEQGFNSGLEKAISILKGGE